MKIKITGKEVKATEAIKDYISKKMSRIEKYFEGEELTVNVTVKVEKNEQIAEIQVNVKGDIYRAVTAHKDLYASIDSDIDILEGQIRKWKTKKERQLKDSTAKIMAEALEEKHEVIENEIMKTLYYEIKPITPEDAILKLQEKPTHNFFVFINVETGKVNVIHKLKDGKNYGLIEPEA